MSLTITIPGAVNVTTGAMAPAVLTIGVGVPGAAGPAGPAGPGVPVGGTAGQFLTKIDGTNYNTDWTTVNLSGYAPLASPAFTGNPTAPTAALGDNDTSIATTAFVQQELLSGTANARNLEVYVRNQTGSTIPAGSIVYINGATGNRPTITLAQANNDANSAQTFGFTKASIANNGFGFVIVRGECENLDTSAVAEGTQLYLSPTVAGAYTTTKPSAPEHLVYVGIVIRSHPTQGVILVAVQNGYELNELHDVSITSPTNGQVLKYNSTTGLWYNGTDSAGVAWGGITGTLSSQTDLQSALNAKANLSGATFTGKVGTTASATTAPLNVAVSTTAPTITVAGDIWVGTNNIFFKDSTNTQRALLNNNTTNTFSSPQIVDTTATTAALRVTQKGTGNAIEVEDSTTPDATRFVIDQHGKVGVGVAPDATAALKVDTNGIMFGDGTTQTTAATLPTYSQSKAIADMLTSAITSVSGDGSGYTANFSAPWTQYMTQVVDLSNFTANGGPLTFGAGSFTSTGGGEYQYLYYNGVQATFPFFYIPV